MSSDHQNPTGQPVVDDTAGFDSTMAIRLGRPVTLGLRFLWLTVIPPR